MLLMWENGDSCLESLVLVGNTLCEYLYILAVCVGERRHWIGEYLYIVVRERRQLLEEFVFSFQF